MKSVKCLAVFLAINFKLCVTRSIPQEESPTPHSQPPSVSPEHHSPPPSAQHSLQPPGPHQPPLPPPEYYQQPGYYQPNPGYPYSPGQYHPSRLPFGLDPKYLLLLNGGLTGGGFLNNPMGGFSQNDNPLGTLLLLNQLGDLGGGFAPYQPNTVPWGCSLQFGAVNCPNLYPGHHSSPTPAYPQHPQPPVYQPQTPAEYPPPPPYQPPPPYKPPPPAYQ